MATLYTDISTAETSGLLADRVESDLGSGELRYIEATYTCTGAEGATGDSIAVCNVPVGAVVIPELCRVSNEAAMGGASIALPTLGDVGDADRYSATSISIHSSNAATAAVTPNVVASVIPRYAVVEANKTILAVLTRTDAPTAGKKIRFLIAYRLA